MIDLRDFLASAEETHKGLIHAVRATARNRDGVLLANSNVNSRTSRRNLALRNRELYGNAGHIDDINLVGSGSDSSRESRSGFPGG